MQLRTPLVSLLLMPLALLAQHTNTQYVSMSGSDAGWSAQGCPRTSPCRSLQAALLTSRDTPGAIAVQVLDAGDYGRMQADFAQIGPDFHVSPANGSVIDGGGFGTVTINDWYGTFAPIPGASAANTPPLGTFAAVVLEHDVTLRNLTIDIAGDASTPYVALWVRGGRVRLENVTITGPGMIVGILVTGGGTVTTSNVTVKGVNGTAVYVKGGAANLRDTRLEGVGSGTTGLFLSGASGGLTGAANLERTELTQFGNAIGVDGSLGSAVARISNCVITSNLQSMATTGGGVVTSLRNNTIEGNGVNNVPPFNTSLK